MTITEFQEATIRRLKPLCGLDDAAYRILLREDFNVHSAKELTSGLAEYLILTLRILVAAGRDGRDLPNGARRRWQCLICGHLLREEVVWNAEFHAGVDGDASPQHCGHTVLPHFLLEHEWNSDKIPH